MSVREEHCQRRAIVSYDESNDDIKGRSLSCSDMLPAKNGTYPCYRRTKSEIKTPTSIKMSSNFQEVDNLGYESEEVSDINGATLVSVNANKGEDHDDKEEIGIISDPKDVASSLSDEPKRWWSILSLKRYRGILLSLLSALLLSFCTLFVALLSGSISSNEVVFNQMLTLLLLSFPMATFQKASFRLTFKAYILLLYRSVMGSIVSLLAYYSFQVMPMGNAKAILYSSPVFTALFSCILLHEACSALDVVLAGVTLSGVLLVIQPPFIFGGKQTASSFLGPLFCIIGAVIIGTIFVSLRKLAVYRVNPFTLLVFYAPIGMLVSGIATTALQQWVIPNCGEDRIYLFLNATFTFLAQVTMTIAFKYEKATTVSLVRTSDVLFTFILEFLVFGTIPNYITIIGAAMVIGSLVGFTLNQRRLSDKRQHEEEVKVEKEVVKEKEEEEGEKKEQQEEEEEKESGSMTRDEEGETRNPSPGITTKETQSKSKAMTADNKSCTSSGST